MSKLSTKSRNALPDSAFAGPHRSYPVNDRAHAADAKSRASAAENAGRMSESAKEHIFERANAVLHRNQHTDQHN